MDVKPEQPVKANRPIDVTLLGMVVFLHPAIRVLVAVSIIALQLSRESYLVFPFSTVIDVRPSHSENAPYSIDVTLFPIITDDRLWQPRKAPPLIDVTLLGMVTDVRPEQPEKAWDPIDVTL